MSSKSQSESDIAKTLDLDRAASRGRRLKRWLIIILLVAVVVVVVVMRRGAGNSATTQWGSKDGRNTRPMSCQAGSSSGWRLPARSSRDPPC